MEIDFGRRVSLTTPRRRRIRTGKRRRQYNNAKDTISNTLLTNLTSWLCLAIIIYIPNTCHRVGIDRQKYIFIMRHTTTQFALSVKAFKYVIMNNNETNVLKRRRGSGVGCFLDFVATPPFSN